MSLNCTQRSILISLLVAILVYLVMGQGQAMTAPVREKYTPSPITSTADPKTAGKTLKDVPYDMKCTPGTEMGGYYSKDLTPGGFCGDQEFVNAVMHKYTIDEGIGGSLLKK